MAEGDKVVVRFRGRGTHQGETEAFGPPTGKRMEMTGITIKRLSDGKIVEAWTNFDALGMMQQLGLIPEAGQEEARAAAEGERAEEKGLIDRVRDRLMGQ